MDATEFFREVVRPNYEECLKNPHSFIPLWNALVSLNTVAEFVALEQKEYREVSGKELMKSANQLRGRILHDLKYCVETLKHVRKIDDRKMPDRGFTTVATSTGILPNEPATWQVNKYDLRTVLHQAYAVANLPEFK